MGNTLISGELLSSNIPDDTDFIPAVADTVYTATETCSLTQYIYGGAMGFVWKTPAAGSMTVGWTRKIKNASSEYIVVNNGPAGTLFEFLGPYATLTVTLRTASAAGTWSVGRGEIVGWNYDSIRHDFNSGVAIADWIWFMAGTGAAYGSISHSYMSGHTGTTTTGRAAMTTGYATYSAQSGFGAALCDQRVSISALSSVGDEFIVNTGLYGNTWDVSTPLEGMFFRYDRLNYGANWRCCYSAGSVISEVDSGVVVATPNKRFTIVLKSDRTRADYYIDKALVGTLTFVAASNNKAMAVGIHKTAGTTSAYFGCEYAYFERRRTDR